MSCARREKERSCCCQPRGAGSPTGAGRWAGRGEVVAGDRGGRQRLLKAFLGVQLQQWTQSQQHSAVKRGWGEGGGAESRNCEATRVTSAQAKELFSLKKTKPTAALSGCIQTSVTFSFSAGPAAQYPWQRQVPVSSLISPSCNRGGGSWSWPCSTRDAPGAHP